MTSTLASNSDLLVDAVNFGLSFTTQLYRGQTLRDKFVEVVSNPFEALRREKEKVLLFDGIDFQIRRGDRLGLLGLNGVGKTSLCRCISKHYRPQKGKLNVYGKVRAIFDTTVGIYPELTGRENAHLLGKLLYPEKIDVIDTFIEEALEFSELREFLDAPFRIYSNGMQARLCLSIISCMPSDVLILDEVFDGADRLFREKISKRILAMIEKSGAVIFVSHSTEQIEKVCNRVMVLDHGKIAYDGPTKEGLIFFENIKPQVDRFTTS